MARSCVYTGQPIHNGACDTCACSDEGTGEDYDTTLDQLAAGTVTMPTECSTCGHYDLAHDTTGCNGRTSILGPIAYGMGMALQTGNCDCTAFHAMRSDEPGESDAP